jgi:hypothetical protein
MKNVKLKVGRLLIAHAKTIEVSQVIGQVTD